jgi:hypothetical protein
MVVHSLIPRVFEMCLRLSIGVDIARGMRYLHELLDKPVIHRDLVGNSKIIAYLSNIFHCSHRIRTMFYFTATAERW